MKHSLTKRGKCPACNSTDSTDINDIRKDAHYQNPKKTKIKLPADNFNLKWCNNCTLVYYDEYLENLNEFYADSYRSKDGFEHPARHIDNQNKCHLWQHCLKPHLKKGMAILDVGCAEGFWVDYLNKTLKMDAKGVDLNPIGIEYGKSKGIPIDTGDIHSYQGKKLDLIFSSGVFEHIPDIQREIKAYWNNLKFDGILYIQTPWIRNPNEAHLSDYFPYEHLQVFGEDSITAFLEKNGFDVLVLISDLYNGGFAVIGKKRDLNMPDKKIEKQFTLGDLFHISEQHKKMNQNQPFIAATHELNYYAEVKAESQESIQGFKANYVRSIRQANHLDIYFLLLLYQNIGNLLSKKIKGEIEEIIS